MFLENELYTAYFKNGFGKILKSENDDKSNGQKLRDWLLHTAGNSIIPEIITFIFELCKTKLIK